jgi:hypothetical protein
MSGIAIIPEPRYSYSRSIPKKGEFTCSLLHPRGEADPMRFAMDWIDLATMLYCMSLPRSF